MIRVRNTQCAWDEAWVGRCNKPVLKFFEDGRGFCEKHSNELCCSCGSHATHNCDHTSALVCGASLCDACEGFTDNTVDHPGKYRHRHVHKKKGETMDEMEVRKENERTIRHLVGHNPFQR